MKVLVIPDIHLKPRIFDRASEILTEKNQIAFIYRIDNVLCTDCSIKMWRLLGKKSIRR